jgi:hypothetical protein
MDLIGLHWINVVVVWLYWQLPALAIVKQSRTALVALVASGWRIAAKCLGLTAFTFPALHYRFSFALRCTRISPSSAACAAAIAAASSGFPSM